MIAPHVGSVIQHDATITADHPYPQTPASMKQQLLDHAAAEYAELLIPRQDVASDIVELVAEFTAGKAREGSRISQARADVTVAATDAYFAALARPFSGLA